MSTTTTPTASPQDTQDTMRASAPPALLQPSDTFVRRHIGPNAQDIQEMLQTLGLDSLDDLVEKTVPESIRIKKPLKLGEPRGEFEMLAELKALASKNKI